MKIIVLKMLICFCFYLLGAYATTDILRLLRGKKDTEHSVSGRGCFCPVCGVEIHLYEQIPIFSYLFKRGRCKKCNARIPVANFILEVVIFIYMAGVSLISDFSMGAYGLCILYYETVKVLMILHYGRRKNRFWRNLMGSFGLNAVLFALLGFLFLVKNIV